MADNFDMADGDTQGARIFYAACLLGETDLGRARLWATIAGACG